jgi:capsular exopolysaccharide synthesis family protein
MVGSGGEHKVVLGGARRGVEPQGRRPCNLRNRVRRAEYTRRGQHVSVVDFTPPAPVPERPEGALEPYLRAIRNRWLVVALVTLAALGGAIAWLSLREPDYKATADILVTPLPPEDTTLEGLDVIRADPAESTRTVQTAATLVDSPEAATLAARRLGPGWDRDRVQSTVEVEPKGESNILGITALVESAPLSARVANEFARATLDVRDRRLRRQAAAKLPRQLETFENGGLTGEAQSALGERIERLEGVSSTGDPTLSLSQRAVPPGAPVGAPSWLVLALALIGGFTLGTGAALLMEMLDRRVREEEELRRIYPLPVLAHVPAVSRRNRRALRSPLSTPPEVREAFRTLQVQLDRTGERPRVLMLTSASTGDAKTTSAVNLAVALVGGGHKVMLIDFDLRKPDVGNLLDIQPKRRLTSLLDEDTQIADLLVEAPSIHTLRVLAADSVDDVLLLEPLSRRLPELFEEARKSADYIVVDTPPLGEVSDALRLVDLVDDVIVVARPGNTHRANLELMRDMVGRTGRTPTGFIIIGEPPGRVSTYYQYGTMRPRDADDSVEAGSARR